MKRGKLKELIIKECAFPDDLDESSRLDSAGWDSLGVIHILSIMKREFGVSCNVEKLMACVTLKDLLDLANEQYEK